MHATHAKTVLCIFTKSPSFVADIRLKIFLGILLTCALSVFSNVQADDTEVDDTEVDDTEEDDTEEDDNQEDDNEEDDNEELQSMMFEADKEHFEGECRTCGRGNDPKYYDMIIKGNTVSPPYRYPWTVAIKKKENNEVFCGGAILNEYYILSAAHCYVTPEAGEAFEPSNKKMEYISSDQIIVGFLTKTHKTEDGPPVKEIIPHPEFRMSHMKHDIALLKLSRKLICNQFRSPICLPSATERPVVRGTFTITGWGTVKGGNLESSKDLKEAKIKLLGFSKCEHRFPKNMKDYIYCLVGIDGRGPCEGDSGGPMFNKRDGKYYLWGVTSLHSSEKCIPDEPFSYTPVFKHLQWIKEVMGSSSGKFLKRQPEETFEYFPSW